MVVFWSFEEVCTQVNDQGDEVTVMAHRDRPLIRYYPVFNLTQCEEIEVTELGEIPPPITSCEEMIARNAPVIRPGDPAYAPAADVISMPGIDRFETPEEYYAAFFHEMTQLPPHRLKRHRHPASVRSSHS